MLEPNRISDRDLRRLVTKGDESGIRPDWVKKVKRLLASLNIATAPEELDVPGNGFHLLKGDRAGTYATWLSKNWRLTFKWDDRGPYNVQMEDYHGS